MGTTAQKLQNVVDSKTDIGKAILEKGGSVPQKFIEYGDAIRGIRSSDPEMDDVVFYNLDGTVVWSGTYKEAQALDELPIPKQIDGLTFQEWNWTKSDLTYLDDDAPWACIAPHYVPTDGKTHFFVKILSGINTNKIVFSRFRACVSTTTTWSFTIDWGDGSDPETYDQTARDSSTTVPTHTYSQDGDYEITLEATTPFSIYPYGNTNYCILANSNATGTRNPICRTVTKIYTGTNFRNNSSGDNMRPLRFFSSCEMISIHKNHCIYPSGSSGFTQNSDISVSDSTVKIVTQPRGTTALFAYFSNNCVNLINPCLPRTITNLRYPGWLGSSRCIKRISLNKGTTRFSSGDFGNTSLIVRFDIPESVRLSIGDFALWRGWSAASNEWNRYVGWRYTGSGAVTIDAASYSNCCMMEHVFIYVGADTTSITFAANTFQNARKLKDIWFVGYPTFVPAINSSTTFFGLFSTSQTQFLFPELKIHVPKALYEDWIANSAWSVAAPLIVPYEPGECPVFNYNNLKYRGITKMPYDAEVEYLESTGTQYINTFLVPNTNLTLTATFGITINSNFDDSGSIFISGRNNTASTNVLLIMIRTKNLIYIDSVDGRKQMTVSPNITSTGTYTISLGTTTATLSGDSTGSIGFNGADASGSNSILIFRDRATGYAPTNIKLYSLKIWKSGSLVRDLIPVRKGTKGYLFDKVTEWMLGNSGTGDFVVGPDV